MSEGKILAAHQDGAYILKLQGDVRVTLSANVDDYLAEMLDDQEFESVIIDLCDAVGIDSTTLGLLAKLAIQAKQRFGFVPVVMSSNASITRILESMGFDSVFDIRHQNHLDDVELEHLPLVHMDEPGVCVKVIEAHRILMGMNDRNHAEFKDLVDALEAQCPAAK